MIPYTITSGARGPFTYRSSAVSVLPDGKVRIGAFGRIEFSETRLGVYCVEISGRLDGLNPNVIMGVWLYDHTQVRGNELDFEYSQFGDPKRGDRVLLSCYQTGKQIRCGADSYSRRRVYISYEANVSRVRCDVPIGDVWEPIWFLEDKTARNVPGCTLRIAGSVIGDALMKGMTSSNPFTVDNVSFQPV